MPKVELRHKNESFDSLMRRFKKSVEKSGLLNDVRDREFYEKPSETRKRAKAAAVKRTQREQSENRIYRKTPNRPTVKTGKPKRPESSESPFNDWV